MDPNRFLGKLGVAAVAFRSDALKRIQGATRSMPHLSPNELAQGEDFRFQVRNAFTIDANQINLNSGRVSPAPRVAQEAMEHYWTIVNMSPSLWVDELPIHQRETLRQRLAGLFRCDPVELAITRTTTKALEIVQSGMELEPGDEVDTFAEAIADEVRHGGV